MPSRRISVFARFPAKTCPPVLLAVLLAAAGASALPAAESTWFVSPGGRDDWSGRPATATADGSDGPLATLAKAVERARQEGNEQARRIVLRAGEYYFEQPVELGPADSKLVVEAAEGEQAILHGGRPLGGWQRDGDRFWTADIPGAADRSWDFRMLSVNNRLAPRARLPREGTFLHRTEFTVPWMSTTGGGWKRKPTEEELTTMAYRPEDLPAELDIRNAELTVYHMWDESIVGIAQNDLQNHVFTFSNRAGHPAGAFGVKKYVAWNTREGMSEPGQWYLDRTAEKVVYWPMPGEDMATLKAIAPRVESILRIRGEGERPVRDVTIRGLAFSVTNTRLISGGFGAGAFPGAVELFHAENCRLVGLEIRNVAGQGVKAWNLTGCTIEDCHVHHTGACGLKFGGECLVRNNHVHHVGRIYPSGIAVWGGGRDGKVCRIEHNTIHDTSYSAINCGGDDHRIEHNRIYRAMQVLHDGAGIYIGFGKRIVLRGNYIHDIVDTGGYGASAYYLDEQAEDCLVEGNLSVRVARPSHNHMATKNTIRRNVFICEGDATLTFPRSSDFTMEQNVIVAEGAIRITRPEAITHANGNVLFSRSGKVEGIRLDEYRHGEPQPLPAGSGWVLGDPGLSGFEDGRVQFDAAGAAAGLGIPALDVSKAGATTPKP
ncbi:MAG: right-handed parallel beta-helix repeat-containing protein [Patescibacteria group bacterium]|nr:right-handed parallel beta-helix repeat-containing protein [Patescibacteria group bacterium]